MKVHQLVGREEDAGRVQPLLDIFAEGLERRLRGVRIELWDERLTTVEAERTMDAGGLKRRRRKASDWAFRCPGR